MSFLSVWISHPDRIEACNLVESLVEKGLAACGHVFEPGLSIYRWEGEVVRGVEVMILLKTTSDCSDMLIEQVKKNHPYQVPEIIFQVIDGGSPSYLSWISESIFPFHPKDTPSGEH